MTDISACAHCLRVVVVDDEALARSRLRTLLTSSNNPEVIVVGDAANATQAMTLLQDQTCDVLLLDVQMPGGDGISLARVVRELAHPPALIFVTAHAEYAVKAFDLEAVDYLTKPVRLERLQAALHKAERYLLTQRVAHAEAGSEECVYIQERGRTARVYLSDVLYFKAELKYITVRTANRSYILDGSLSELETKYSELFVRAHRNALIARRAVRALEKQYDAQEGGEVWAVRLEGIPEALAVSRRQLSVVRSLLSR